MVSLTYFGLIFKESIQAYIEPCAVKLLYSSFVLQIIKVKLNCVVISLQIIIMKINTSSASENY